MTDSSGASRPIWVGGFATEDDAKEARDQARMSARRREFVHPNQITVEQYLRGRLGGHALEVRPKTLEGYRLLIDRYIVPRIGKMRLQSVKASTLSALYATLLREGGRSKQPLSAPTVAYVHSTLRKAFNDAVSTNQVLAVNPALRAKRPKVEAVSGVHDVWDAQQLAHFLGAVSGDRLYRSSGWRRIRERVVVS